MKTLTMICDKTNIRYLSSVLNKKNSILLFILMGSHLGFTQSNVAINKVASASKTHSSASANSLIDGNYATAWNAGSYAPQWVSINLQGQYDISKIKLIPTLSPSGNTTQEIFVSSDLSSWQSVDVFTIYTTEKTPIERVFSTPLKNIKGVKVLTSKSPSWVAWYEIEIYGIITNNEDYNSDNNIQTISNDVKPINIAINKVASASKTHSSASANSLIDGNYATAWNSGSYAPQWVSINLQGQYDISKIKLIPTLSPSGNTTQEIFVSSDLSSWQSVDVFTIYTTEKTPIERVFSTPLKNIKGVKVLTSNSPSWVAWYEIEIYGATPNTNNYSNNNYSQTVNVVKSIDKKEINLAISFSKEFSVIEKPDLSKYEVAVIKKQSKKSDLASLVTYGDMFYYGYDKIERNEVEAILNYKKAADQGNALAQYKLATIYRQNTATVSDAIKYYNMAVEQNYEPAVYDLAILYLNGSGGISKDYSKAKELLQKNPSNMKAKTELGKLYLSSDITTFNLKADLQIAKSLFQDANQIGIFNEWLNRLDNFGKFRYALSKTPTLINGINTEIDFKNEAQIKTLIDQLILQSELLGAEKINKYTYDLIDNLEVVNSTISKQYEDEWYQTAIKSKSPAKLKAFVNRFPNSTYRKSALDEITNLDNEKFKQAKSNNTTYSYQQYLELFPLGLNADEARNKIKQIEQEEKLAIEKQNEEDRQAKIKAQQDKANAEYEYEQNRKNSIINASVGDRLCFSQGWTRTESFFFMPYTAANYTMSIICFIEGKAGENYQVRIADVSSSKRSEYSSPDINGVKVSKGDVIWVKPLNDSKWHKCD